MRVLSLFDGMSCGRISLDNLGVDCEYYASEIDKYATKVSEANYPDIIRLGDVTKWKEWDIDWNFDLLLGGSPCQGFSFAGKQLAFDDPRSALFFVYVDILNHIKSVNPNVKFLLENVRMKKEFLQVITDQLGVEPVIINSALLSAQNRVRFYWFNWQVEQPQDKGILLKDIIEQAETERDKSHCIDANYYKGATWEQYKAKHRRQQVLCNQVGIASDIKGNDSIKRIYATDGKSPCLTTMGGGHREPKIAIDKANYLTTVQKDNLLILDKSNYSERSKKQIKKNSKKPNQKAVSVCTNSNMTGSGVNIITNDDISYRKLTPLECERLQTVPDNYTNHVSNTQRYKMLGNGWTVDVISHILKGAL